MLFVHKNMFEIGHMFETGHYCNNYASLAKGTFHFTIYNVTFGKSKMADVDMFGS